MPVDQPWRTLAIVWTVMMCIPPAARGQTAVMVVIGSFNPAQLGSYPGALVQGR
jgi:hypothetical protein